MVWVGSIEHLVLAVVCQASDSIVEISQQLARVLHRLDQTFNLGIEHESDGRFAHIIDIEDVFICHSFILRHHKLDFRFLDANGQILDLLDVVLRLQLAGLYFVQIRLSGLLVVTYGRAQPIIKIVLQ